MNMKLGRRHGIEGIREVLRMGGLCYPGHVKRKVENNRVKHVKLIRSVMYSTSRRLQKIQDDVMRRDRLLK